MLVTEAIFYRPYVGSYGDKILIRTNILYFRRGAFQDTFSWSYLNGVETYRGFRVMCYYCLHF